MKYNWDAKRLSEIAYINPRESIGKGSVAKKVPMDGLQPFCRDISEFIFEEYKGGSKFKNGDTIMARITPCLENGKIAKVSILEDDEVGFGSTEYIVLRAIAGISDADFCTIWCVVLWFVIRQLNLWWVRQGVNEYKLM